VTHLACTHNTVAGLIVYLVNDDATPVSSAVVPACSA
jgi:hypothetical protein